MSGDLLLLVYKPRSYVNKHRPLYRNMDYLTILYFGISTVTFYIFLRMYSRRKLPSGPKGVPFFGNLFEIDLKNPHHTLTDWAKEHGDIYLIRLLGQDKIVLSGEEFIREAAVKNADAFANRPHIVRIHDICLKGAFTVGFSNVSDRWKKVKKTVTTSLKGFGSGLKRIEMLTHDAADEMLEVIDARNGEAFDPQDLFQEIMVKIIYSLIYGKKLSSSEAEKIIQQERILLELTVTGGQGLDIEVMPWLKYFRKSYVKALEDICEETEKVHIPAIKARVLENDITNESTVLDALINYNKMANSEKDKLTDFDMFTTIRDLIIAGMSTSAAALYSFIGMCINYPLIAERMKEEIDNIIGSRHPTLDDIENMPYVNAAILELLRIISHIPTSLPHETTKEVDIGGYTLPKGQEVWLNLWSLHHDERYWDDPWVYRPERFLTEDGKLVSAGHINRRRLMAFGAGRRLCIGETMAKSRLFIIICLLLQRYDLLPEAEDKHPISDPRHYILKLVIIPPSYKVKFTPRKT